MATKLCNACARDQGFCVYCQRQFDSPQKLHTHIKRSHKDTVRRTHCDDFVD